MRIVITKSSYLHFLMRLMLLIFTGWYLFGCDESPNSKAANPNPSPSDAPSPSPSFAPTPTPTPTAVPTPLSPSVTLIRGPYLQMNGKNFMIVRWRTDNPSSSLVRYGSSITDLNNFKSIPGLRTEHVVKIPDLSPNTLYFYGIGSNTENLTVSDQAYRFKTAPNDGYSDPVRIWMIGDSGTANDNSNSVYQSYTNYPGSENTSLFILLGDNAYDNGTDDEYQSAVFDFYADLLKHVPIWATLGNHDGRSSDSVDESGPYYEVFTFPRYGELGGIPSGTEAYYSFNFANTHFICLDSYESERGASGAMLAWLENDLQANNLKWVIAYWHHPPYTKGSHDSDVEVYSTEMRENALPILEKYGVDLVFTGHSHSYERSYFIDGHYGSSDTFSNVYKIDSGDGREYGTGIYRKEEYIGHSGAVYTVSGASGKVSGGSLDHPAMYLALNKLGSVVLDIYQDRINVNYLGTSGAIEDNFTLAKGGDNSGPVILNIVSSSHRSVMVQFNEKLDSISALKIDNYVISDEINIEDIWLEDDKVFLSTNSMLPKVQYSITVSNVKDVAGNIIQNGISKSFYSLNNEKIEMQNGSKPFFSFEGISDSVLASATPNQNYGSNDELRVDKNDGATQGELISVIKFDLSLIPIGANVQKIFLELNVSDPSNANLSVGEIAASWGEESVSWQSLSQELIAPRRIGSVIYSSNGANLVELPDHIVQLANEWLNGDLENNGFYIRSENSTDGLSFYSSNVSVITNRPKIVIEYSSPEDQ